MKHIILLSVLAWLTLGMSSAFGQIGVVAGAASQSQSASGSAAQSTASPTSISNAAPGIANLNLPMTTTITSTGSDLGKTVPFTAAPQMTVLGGEDSCLKSRSGGGAISGFGASFGTMVMDHECNRRVSARFMHSVGQTDVALQILCGSPAVWAAYKRLGNSPCLNDQPNNADEIDVAVAGAEVAAGPVDTADDYKWSYPPRPEDDFIY